MQICRTSLLGSGFALAVSALLFAAPAQSAQGSTGALLLVESASGKVLHAENATYPWYPASVTKVMTAYLTLRAVKEGRLKLDTLLAVSDTAMAQQPSKMGFKTGTQVTVDNALKMLMVKSANDMAVVLAEGVSGSVEEFAKEMNRTSERLGMTQSRWTNPNGLPDEQQVTSARDMAILARAVLKEFPEHELYWRIPAIKLGRKLMRNTNRLIDRYPGANGMKTGFICASGFNLVGTASRNGKQLIAVVFGAPSSPVRAERAANLFEKGFNPGLMAILSPSLGSVDSLNPVSATPPDLREDMCGKHRKRPASESSDEEESAAARVPETGTALATLAPLFQGKNKPVDTLLGPLTPSMAPVVVHTGPAKKLNEAARSAQTSSQAKTPNGAKTIAPVKAKPKAAGKQSKDRSPKSPGATGANASAAKQVPHSSTKQAASATGATRQK